jgi:hypothetical protein
LIPAKIRVGVEYVIRPERLDQNSNARGTCRVGYNKILSRTFVSRVELEFGDNSFSKIVDALISPLGLNDDAAEMRSIQLMWYDIYSAV